MSLNERIAFCAMCILVAFAAAVFIVHWECRRTEPMFRVVFIQPGVSWGRVYCPSSELIKTVGDLHKQYPDWQIEILP